MKIILIFILQLYACGLFSFLYLTKKKKNANKVNKNLVHRHESYVLDENMKIIHLLASESKTEELTNKKMLIFSMSRENSAVKKELKI